MIMNYLIFKTLAIIMVASMKPTVVTGNAITTFLSPDTNTLQFTVSGTVRDQDNAPRTGLIVKVFDRNAGTDDKLLGKATTDVQGYYYIGYTTQDLGGKTSANLVISVYQNDKLLQTSDVIFNAGQKVIKDFIIPVITSPEVPRLDKTIKPLLHKKIG
jgi:hypothetical protein